MPRAAAALVAMICWVALGVRFFATYAQNGDVLATLWILARFFTILTDLAVAIAITQLALGRRASDFLLGGLTLSILLVGMIYQTLLQRLFHLSGAALVADILLHKVSPVVVPLYWLLFAPHRRLKWSAPLWWSLFPLVYFAYALGRGAIDGIYPYPFIDVGKIGAAETALNAAIIAAAFVVSGEALVWLDRRPLGRRALMSKAPE